MKKLLTVLLACLISLSVFSGCGPKEKELEETVNSDVAVNELADTVEDSSDLPDWTGKKQELVMWYGPGTGSVKRNKKATQDVVTPELERVTGVKFSDDSFDNGGESMEAKVSRLAASGEWPDVLIEPESAVLSRLIEEDLVYDLTDLIPKYMPHLDALIKLGGDDPFMKSDREDGKIYEFSMAPPLSYAYPDMDPTLVSRAKIPDSPYSYVYVRDDILKMIKPEAYTTDELTERFAEKGHYTKEELLNASFNSAEEFIDFLRKVKQLGLKDGNREIYASYAADGSDNWMLMSYLSCVFGRYIGTNAGATYFTYYDREKDEVLYTFKQDFFKEELKTWNQLVREDVLSKDSLIDNRAAFEEKVASGQYALLYGTSLPSIDTINANNNGFKYRKVIINIPLNRDKYLATKSVTGGNHYAIMKKNISEDELPQVLRFFDFMLTDVGQKLFSWGPRSAGLFTEENGVRQFVDEELVECMAYNTPNEKSMYYGLDNQAWPGYPTGTNRQHPRFSYPVKATPAMASKYFSMGIVEPDQRINGVNADITRFDEQGVKAAKTFWMARTAFEKALTKIFIAESDDEFEKLYKDMVDVAERNGLTDDVLPEFNEAFEKMNEGKMDKIRK